MTKADFIGTSLISTLILSDSTSLYTAKTIDYLPVPTLENKVELQSAVILRIFYNLRLKIYSEI